MGTTMTINNDVFNTLRGFGYLIKMYDIGGVGPIADPQSAAYIFASDNDDNEKNLMVRLPKDSQTEFPTLVVYKSQKKFDTFVKVFQTLKNIAITNGYSITIREMGETIHPKQFAYAPKGEKERQARLSESKESNDLRLTITNDDQDGDVAKTLIDNGWKKLNDDSFSGVYGKVSIPFVVKVCYKCQDTDYDAFVQIIKNNKNKHFPVILDEFIVDESYVYFIEDLQPTVVSYKDINDMEKYFDYLGLVDYDGYDKQKKFVKDFENDKTTLAAAIKILKDTTHHDNHIDFHNKNNIMKRSDGTLVFANPFDVSADYYDEDFKNT